MTRHTVVGQLASNDGAAAATGRGAWASAADEYRPRQPHHVPVDIGHSGEKVGRVVHLERCAGGLFAVCEMDVPEPAVRVRVGADVVELADPTFFSAHLNGRHDGTDLELISIGICHRSARVGARPLVWFEGGLERRGAWTSDPFLRGVLNRAGEEKHRRAHGGPLIVHRHRAHQQLERLADGAGHLDPVTGHPVPTRRDTGPTGPTWIRPGRILDVS